MFEYNLASEEERKSRLEICHKCNKYNKDIRRCDVLKRNAAMYSAFKEHYCPYDLWEEDK